MMTPHPMIERRLEALKLPRLRISAGSATKAVVRRRTTLIDRLIDDGQVTVLKALIDGIITIQMLDDYARESPLTGTGLTVLVRGQMTITDAFAEALPSMGKGRTNLRYALSLSQVRAAFGETRLVRELATLPWATLLDTRKSAADAHHVRRAISRFLSVWYGKQHPARHAVLAAFPALPTERSRVPELSRTMFARIVQAARADIRPGLVTLVVTGLRVGEYLALRPQHLRHGSHRLQVPGTKTSESAAVVGIDPAIWPVVVAAVPSPVQYRQFSKLWKEALRAAGVDRHLRLHDLRHCHGQWAVDAGGDEGKVQRSLRHTSGAMTRKYTLTNDTRAVSALLTQAVGPALAALSGGKRNGQ